MQQHFPCACMLTCVPSDTSKPFSLDPATLHPAFLPPCTLSPATIWTLDPQLCPSRPIMCTIRCGKEVVLVNPTITKYSKAKDMFEEGCLSFPKIYADVEVRP